MKLPISLTCFALFGLAMVGCNKAEEPAPAPAPTTAPSTTPAPTPTAGMPDLGGLANVDFSSPEKITATVIPALKDLLAKNPALKDCKLDVTLKDKVLHVMGDVKNNDQKRAIDAVWQPLAEKAKAAGINFLNGAIVKG